MSASFDYDSVIIGGGPAGLMAAAQIAASGCRTLIIDKNNIPGKKLRITGKGRCNVTNACDFNSLMENIPTNPKFLFSSLRSFSNFDIIDFFESLGVETVTERGERVFPKSQKAADVADALVSHVKSCGTDIFLNTKVTDILTKENAVCGVKCQTGSGDRKEISARTVIIATGGLSYPLTGSTGDGYRFAESIGHSIIKPRASLAALLSGDSFMADLKGLSLRNISIILYSDGRPVYSDFGELLFTGSGVSGPVILSASAYYKQSHPTVLSIDLKPALDEKTLYERIRRDFTEYDRKIFANSLDKLLPRKMIPVVVKRSGISPVKQVNQISKDERMRIINLLKNFTVNIDAIDDVKNAIVTAGGVCVKEVNPKTMESLFCKGLYFAGEVLDVDGYTGGFNLTIAFSTGHAAGRAACAFCLNKSK